MDPNNAVNSSQLSEQMNTAIPNEVLTSVSADPGGAPDGYPCSHCRGPNRDVYRRHDPQQGTSNRYA